MAISGDAEDDSEGRGAVQVLLQTENWCPRPQRVALDQGRMLPAAERGPLQETSPEWGWDSLVRGRGDALAPASKIVRLFIHTEVVVLPGVAFLLWASLQRDAAARQLLLWTAKAWKQQAVASNGWLPVVPTLSSVSN